MEQDDRTLAGITEMIRKAKTQDGLNELFESIYPNLRNLAKGNLSRMSDVNQIGVTEVVHDAFLELKKVLEREGVDFENRKRFYSYAGMVMRHAICKQRRHKIETIDIDENFDHTTAPNELLQNVNEALDLLSKRYPRACQAFDLRYFAGYELDEILSSMEYKSVSTLKADLAAVRSMLNREMGLKRKAQD